VLREREEAELFLLEALAEGPRPMNDLKSRAQATGVSERTLKRAKNALAIVSRRADGGKWYWELPPAT
jgi:putative DNA primase/helicase